MQRPLLLAAATIILGGCGPAEDSAPPPAAERAEPSVFDPLTDTLDRAAGVEATLRDAAEERRRQLEAEE